MPEKGFRAVLILSETVFSYFPDWSILECLRRFKYPLSEQKRTLALRLNSSYA